jgi:hypothetical protein
MTPAPLEARKKEPCKVLLLPISRQHASSAHAESSSMQVVQCIDWSVAAQGIPELQCCPMLAAAVLCCSVASWSPFPSLMVQKGVWPTAGLSHVLECMTVAVKCVAAV